MSQPIDANSLFLQESDDRSDVQPSVVAKKAIIRSPPNLAMYDEQGNPHEVLEHVIKLANNFLSTYQNQWSALQGKWERADELYWMAQKESRMPDLTLAKVSASVFYRVCRRLADGAYIATFSDDMPVKFKPDIGVFDESETKQKKAVVAEALNRWATYCMKKTDLKNKARKSFNWTYKYGNHIVYVPYDFEVERCKKYVTRNPNQATQSSDGSTVFKHERTGEYKITPHPDETYEVEYDKITKDEVGFHPLKIHQCSFDNRIDDLDRQTCFIYDSDITRGELFAKGKAGTFKNLDKITELQRFNQYDWSNYPEQQRIRDSGKTTSDSVSTEIYKHSQIWINLPHIEVKTNKKGEPVDMTWDQNNLQQRRYVLDLIGGLGSKSSICVRFSESPYWSNGIPFISAHSHEDDSGWWHRGLQELLDDQILQEQVFKGQLIDNSTLLNRRPVIRVIGRCRTKDMRIGVNKVFDVTSKDALEFMQIPDLTANLNNVIESLKKDSEDVAQTPPFMLGEGIGGRASATEFATVRDQSSAPALGDIKNLNMQICGGYMKKIKEYAPQFLDKDMAIEMAGQQGEQYSIIVSPDDFNMDLEIDEIAVQEFENKSTMRQILLNLVQLVASPAFAPFINIAGFLERVFMTFSNIFPNPEEIINKDKMVQELLKQYLSQVPPADQQSPNAGAGPQGLPQAGAIPQNLIGLPKSYPGLELGGPDGIGMASNGGASGGA